MAEYDPEEMFDAVRDEVQKSAALNWTEDWFEPELSKLPVVRARPAGFAPTGAEYREALQVQMIYGVRTRRMNYRGLTTAHKELLIALLDTGYFPMLRPSGIEYGIKIGDNKRDYVGANFMLLSADVT